MSVNAKEPVRKDKESGLWARGMECYPNRRQSGKTLLSWKHLSRDGKEPEGST